MNKVLPGPIFSPLKFGALWRDRKCVFIFPDSLNSGRFFAVRIARAIRKTYPTDSTTSRGYKVRTT